MNIVALPPRRFIIILINEFVRVCVSNARTYLLTYFSVYLIF